MADSKALLCQPCIHQVDIGFLFECFFFVCCLFVVVFGQTAYFLGICLRITKVLIWKGLNSHKTGVIKIKHMRYS